MTNGKGGRQEPRRSVRIWAIEEAKKDKPKSTNGAPKQNRRGATRKKGRKRKKLEDVGIAYFALQVQRQEGETSNQGENSNRNAILSSPQGLPEKRILESVLDILQRKDTREFFAEPVDPKEVEHYDTVIKEPMDFGTMRAKLHEGMYTSLEQFQHDVFLIFDNAMLFNGPTTVFYKEARAIHELAQEVFHALTSDPENLERQFSHTRRRRGGRKPQAEAGNLQTKLDGTYRGRNARTYLGSSSSNSCAANTSGSKDGRNLSLFGPESCQTYKPWASFLSANESIASAVYTAPKQLAPINLSNVGYEESLMRFAKDLGPTAQMVANRKLEKYRAEALKFQSPIPTLSMSSPSSWIPAPNVQRESAFLDGVSKGPLLRAFLGELPRDSNLVNYANQQLGVCGDADRVRNVHKNEGINIHSTTYVNARKDIDNTTSSGDMSSICGNMGSSSLFKNGFLGALSSNAYGNMENLRGKITMTSDNNTDLFHGTSKEDFDCLNKKAQFQSDLYVPAPRVADLNYPACIPNSSSNYPSLDMALGSSQTSNQLPPAATNSFTGLLQFMSGSSDCSNSSFLPLKAANTAPTSLSGFANFASLYSNQGASSSSRASQPPEWNQRTLWGTQAMHNPVGQTGSVQNELQLGSPSATPISLQLNEAPNENQQGEAYTPCLWNMREQASKDNQQPDLALQL